MKTFLFFQLEPYNQKLTQSLLNVIDQNETVEDLKKSFYSMILNFMTKPQAIELLQEAAGKSFCCCEVEQSVLV